LRLNSDLYIELFFNSTIISDQNKRLHIESKLLWKYKKYYAKKAGLPHLTKDYDRISIGEIQDPGLDEKEITFKHIGCLERVPERVLDTLQ